MTVSNMAGYKNKSNETLFQKERAGKILAYDQETLAIQNQADLNSV